MEQKYEQRWITVFWAGDSTVKDNKAATYPQTGIAQGMERYFHQNVHVLNLAENGRSTKSFLDEKRFEPVLDWAVPGDYVFIQFGHNDEKAEDPLRYTDPHTTYKENLRYMVEETRKRGAIPLLITPVARRRFEKGVFVPGSHGAYPGAMMELAEELGVECVDLTRASEELLAELGEQETEKWFMNLAPGEYPRTTYAAGQEDNTHLVYAGAVEMAGLLARELKKRQEVFGRLLCPEFLEKAETNK